MQVDSARKLRWYDRDDLAPLVEASTREKQALQDTVAALRQVFYTPARVAPGCGVCAREWSAPLCHALGAAHHLATAAVRLYPSSMAKPWAQGALQMHACMCSVGGASGILHKVGSPGMHSVKQL